MLDLQIQFELEIQFELAESLEVQIVQNFVQSVQQDVHHS